MTDQLAAAAPEDGAVLQNVAVRPAWIHLFLDTPVAGYVEAVEFWAAVTGCEVSPARGENDQFVTLLPAHGHPWLKLQSIAGPEASMHLDVDSADCPAAVQESRELGASDAWTYHDVAVMRSPGGLLFCHTVTDESDRPWMERGGLDVVADQICLDVPARKWEAEVDFWRRLTGRHLERGLRPEFALLGDPDPAGPPRILLQRLGGDAARVTAHLDLAVRDRQGQARRHERLGARRVRDFERWTVMRAPSGHTYCLTDRDPRTGRVHRGRS